MASLLAVFILIGIALPGGASESPSLRLAKARAVALKRFPDDTASFMFCDLERIRTARVGPAISSILAWAFRGKYYSGVDDFQEFSKATGIKPSRDFHAMLIAASGDLHEGVGLIEGRFDRQLFHSYFHRLGWDLNEENRVYSKRHSDWEISLDGERLLYLGHKPWPAKTLDNLLADHQDLERLISGLAYPDQLWAVFRDDEDEPWEYLAWSAEAGRDLRFELRAFYPDSNLAKKAAAASKKAVSRFRKVLRSVAEENSGTVVCGGWDHLAGLVAAPFFPPDEEIQLLNPLGSGKNGVPFGRLAQWFEDSLKSLSILQEDKQILGRGVLRNEFLEFLMQIPSCEE